MSTEFADRRTVSIFGKLVGPERTLPATVAIVLLLVLLPIGAAFLDGALDVFFVEGYWQVVYLPAAVILYILFVGPILTRMEVNVVEAFRPLVRIDDSAFEQLVVRASRANPIAEAIAFGVGAALGVWAGLVGIEGSDDFWLGLWLVLSGVVMFGLLGWAVYAAVASTRLTSALHRQPLRIDIFDTKPFEPIGRQSLALALVFVGGILLSMVFQFGKLDIRAWPTWFLYLLLTSVIVLVFFLNMRDTHRVLGAAKRKELEAVQKNVLQASRTLMECVAAGESSGHLGAEISALVAYEGRVRGTRTWPYDTAMLRTLSFSLLIPAVVELVKLVFNSQFE